MIMALLVLPKASEGLKTTLPVAELALVFARHFAMSVFVAEFGCFCGIVRCGHRLFVLNQ